MSVYCHVVLRPEATPAQLAALGTALWRWCAGTAGAGGIYQYLDNQALADLMDGRLPAVDRIGLPAGRWCVRFVGGAGTVADSDAFVANLWRAIPGDAVADVLADGVF